MKDRVQNLFRFLGKDRKMQPKESKFVVSGDDVLMVNPGKNVNKTQEFFAGRQVAVAINMVMKESDGAWVREADEIMREDRAMIIVQEMSNEYSFACGFIKQEPSVGIPVIAVNINRVASLDSQQIATQFSGEIKESVQLLLEFYRWLQESGITLTTRLEHQRWMFKTRRQPEIGLVFKKQS